MPNILLIFCIPLTHPLQFTNVEVVDMVTKNKLILEFPKEIQRNLPIIPGKFVKYHESSIHLII